MTRSRTSDRLPTSTKADLLGQVRAWSMRVIGAGQREGWWCGEQDEYEPRYGRRLEARGWVTLGTPEPDRWRAVYLTPAGAAALEAWEAKHGSA